MTCKPEKMGMRINKGASHEGASTPTDIFILVYYRSHTRGPGISRPVRHSTAKNDRPRWYFTSFDFKSGYNTC